MEYPVIYAAPMQGYTGADWRAAHAELFGGSIDRYCAPFIRSEKGSVRQRDMRDIIVEPDAPRPVPQIIFRDAGEWNMLVEAVITAGYSEVDLNLGCPFVPQVRRGRGAGMLAHPEILEEICTLMGARPGVRFSVKMRLGTDDPSQWRSVIGVIDRMPLDHVTLHPRTAVQQYAGQPHYDQAADLIGMTRHRVVINGDMQSPADIDRVIAALPGVSGIMLGRGLLARPTLAAEWRAGATLPEHDRIAALLLLYDAVAMRLSRRLCGDSQLLTHLLSYWDYTLPAIGHRAWKAIRKSTTPASLRAKVENIFALRP